MHPHLLQPLGIVGVRAVRAAVAVAVIAALWMAFAAPVGAQPPPEEQTVVLCNEATGEIVELPKWIAEGALHFPAHPATDAEIAAGECAITAPDFGEGNGGNGEVTLPVPTAVDPVSCGHFETQADAQAYFDSTDLPDPSVLDPDGDGIACEFPFGEVNGGNGEAPGSGQEAPAEVVALPNTGTGTAGPGSGQVFLAGLVAVLTGGLALGLQRRLSR